MDGEWLEASDVAAHYPAAEVLVPDFQLTARGILLGTVPRCIGRLDMEVWTLD